MSTQQANVKHKKVEMIFAEESLLLFLFWNDQKQEKILLKKHKTTLPNVTSLETLIMSWKDDSLKGSFTVFSHVATLQFDTATTSESDAEMLNSE